MNDLIMENQNLVYAIIHEHFANYPNKNDLFQVGMMGLTKAAEHYKPSFNAKLTTYAYTYIYGEMLKFVREDKCIKVSRDLQKLAYKLEKTRLLLMQKYMREPSLYELSIELGIDESQIVEIMQIPNNLESLDEPISENGKMVNLYDYVSNDDYYDMNDKLALKDELERLDKNEQKLIEARYMYDMTQSETARFLGTSQVQVSRHEKRILLKLRDRLTA